MAASKAGHVRDLPERPEASPPGPCLRCPRCGDTFSAYRGDYFLWDPDTPMRCQHCQGRPLLKLVVERRQWEAWKPPAPEAVQS